MPSANGWDLALYRPKSGPGAGQWVWMVFCNDVPIQGFELHNLLGALSWGPMNRKGWLSPTRVVDELE